VAALQLEARGSPALAWERARAVANQAASRGARVVAFPETFLDVEGAGEDFDLWRERLACLARELGVALVGGTLREAVPGDRRPYQTTVVLAATGEERFRYRKVHLFDAAPPGGVAERESDVIRPGESEGVSPFDLPPLGTCGVGICYDLRFPDLWRRLVHAGARTLFMPSSFTVATGKDHWHVLLRARAIENLAWVVAPAQVGVKSGGRVRYGHACVVDPWGTVLADAGSEGDGFALAEIDFDFQDRVRANIPCLTCPIPTDPGEC
jgi:predicted amidohydrolase